MSMEMQLNEPSPNWQHDYSKLLALVSTPEGYEPNDWCLHGFHPNKGHCLIGRDYSFDRNAIDGFSVVFKNDVVEFQHADSLAKWCESQRIWFLEPHNAYKEGAEVENYMPASSHVVELEWVEDEFGQSIAKFNPLINAACYQVGILWFARVELGLTVIRMPEGQIELAHARAWCKTKITEIITPQP